MISFFCALAALMLPISSAYGSAGLFEPMNNVGALEHFVTSVSMPDGGNCFVENSTPAAWIALICSLGLIGWSVFPLAVDESDAIVKFEESFFVESVHIFDFTPYKDELLTFLNKGIVLIGNRQWYRAMHIRGWSNNYVSRKFSMRKVRIRRFKDVDLLTASIPIGRGFPIVFYNCVSQDFSSITYHLPFYAAIILMTNIGAQLPFGCIFGTFYELSSMPPQCHGGEKQADGCKKEAGGEKSEIFRKVNESPVKRRFFLVFAMLLLNIPLGFLGWQYIDNNRWLQGCLLLGSGVFLTCLGFSLLWLSRYPWSWGWLL